MASPLTKTFNGLPKIVKQVLILALFIAVISLIIWAIQKNKKDQLDQFKERPNFNSYSSNSALSENNTTDLTPRDPRPLVDNIFTKLNGYNLKVYPEIVNLLTRLSDEELNIAYNYFAQEYGHAVSMSLTEFIDDQWDGGVYDPAIEKLERKGLI